MVSVIRFKLVEKNRTLEQNNICLNTSNLVLKFTTELKWFKLFSVTNILLFSYPLKIYLLSRNS